MYIVTKVKDDDVVMLIEASLQVEASEVDRCRYWRCSSSFFVKALGGVAVAGFWPGFYRDMSEG